jgi:hypothetical protein
MTRTEKLDDTVASAGEQLFRFAIDRGDLKTILDGLPSDVSEKRVTLEYEIQLLRIVAVGWAIAFFLADSRLKTPLGQGFWEHIRSFSATLSTSASVAVGSDVDYFDSLKQRLDYYVAALDRAGQKFEPAQTIGSAFASACGDDNDAIAVLAGSKMFAHTISAVREFLDDSAFQWD